MVWRAGSDQPDSPELGRIMENPILDSIDSVILEPSPFQIKRGNSFIKSASNLSSEAEVQKRTALEREYVAEEIRQHKVNKAKFEEQYKEHVQQKASSTCKLKPLSQDLQRKGQNLTASNTLHEKTKGVYL
ncbi:hypothetical protein Taro_045277 [Colocasia esculenta]|uniref:Uncharacterized protein n=1 Tax=Colocasia esculenta TaxID=4460 RepID=A0A843WZX3_COLES|nr:hypothetical protein [Colocasia esculenta]